MMRRALGSLLLVSALAAAEALAQPPGQSTVQSLCAEIAAKLASVSPGECDNGLRLTGALSVRGKPIVYRDYAPPTGTEAHARVLLIGGIHGDEYSSVSIVFKWMNRLNKDYAGGFHWRIVPLLNPDGLLQRHSQRTNAHGVDLNRNFLTRYWYSRTQQYWIDHTRRNPRRYPGPHPLSEPESRWLAGEIREFRPDVIVAVHAPYGVLDFDGPHTPPKRLGHLHLNLLGTYPGSLGNYAGVERDIPVLTIELPHAGTMPSASQVSAIWLDLNGWLGRHAPRPVLPARIAGPGSQAGPS